MFYKYVLIKSNWAIVIFVDIVEILDPQINSSDVEVADRIYLRINDTSQLVKEVIAIWFGLGIRDIKELIYSKVGEKNVCFEINQVDFNRAHFQIEGMYGAIREWISKYYVVPIKPVDVEFDKSKNRYLFNIPSLPTDPGAYLL